MKNISLKIKQFFCLVLSFILLTPNGLLAQNMDLTIRVPENLKKDIVPVNYSIQEAQTAWNDLLKAIRSNSKDTSKLLATYKAKTEIAAQKYSNYVANIRGFERHLENVSETGVLKRLASQYADRQTKIPALYNVKENIILERLRNILAGLNESNILKISEAEISELSDIHSRIITTFEDDIFLDYSKLYSKIAKINKESTYLVKQYYKPQDVLLAAYEDLVANKKIAFRANLELRQHPEKLGTVIRDIRRYLRKTNISGKPGFSFFRLLRELRGMDMAEREKYVAYLTDLKPGQKQLLKDIGAIEDTSVRRLTVKKMLKAGPIMLIIGTILVVTTISEVSAQNNFSSKTTSVSKLNELSDKIKKGDVSPTESLEYYSSAASESVILKDIDHALNFTEFVMAKSAADDDIEIIEDIIDNDPELQITLREPNININIEPGKMLNKYSLPK